MIAMHFVSFQPMPTKFVVEHHSELVVGFRHLYSGVTPTTRLIIIIIIIIIILLISRHIRSQHIKEQENR